MSADHTPGPWVVDRSRNIVAHSPVGAVFLADVYSGGPGIATANANARLIAAAPDLLAALESLTDVAEHDGECLSEGHITTARAAIARAKGEA
jgi:hypothetical protein